MTVRREGQGTRDKGQAEIAYGSWSAPDEDGGLLIWPEPARIIELAQHSVAFLPYQDVALGGVPLPELRAAARQAVGREGDGPLIATGHQCELQHPGVWIKNAVMCAAAEACGGAALHIAVDTDAPKHLKLKWPGFSAPITDDPRANSAAWSGLLAPPTPGHIEYLLREAAAARADGRVSELLVRFLRALDAAAGAPVRKGSPPSLPQSLLAAAQSLDLELGLRYRSVPLSRLLETEPWARFVVAIAHDARNFAALYNAALADYRREAAIDSPERPAPDLLVTRKHVEIPFWLDDLASGRRHRAELVDSGGALTLDAPGANAGAPFSFNGPTGDPPGLIDWLRHRRVRLAPRALSLTMFLRLFVCDLFVHGIGGGLYDQVTDRITRAWLGIEPPAFAVATATLYHKLAEGRRRIDLSALRQEEHKRAHEVLGQRKRQWLERIRSAADPHERRRIFAEMHQARRQEMATDPQYLKFEQRLRDAQQQSAAEDDIFDRELLYAIQPPSRLRGLIDRVYREFGLTP